MDKQDGSRLFSDAAKQYADPSIRPRYPPELFERIYQFCEETRDVALDVATGSGQSARELAKEFRQVYAIDTSKEQIQHAEPVSNVHYQVGSAERTGQKDGSIDLITVATAMHWFNIPKFYWEARRILKPTGALVAWSYKFPLVKGNDAATHVIDDLFRHTLQPYLKSAHHIFLEEYTGQEPTASEFRTVKRDELDFEQASSVQKLVQFLLTSGVYASMKASDERAAEKLVSQFREDLLKTIEGSNADTPLTLIWQTFMILAKHPVPLENE